MGSITNWDEIAGSYLLNANINIVENPPESLTYLPLKRDDGVDLDVLQA
ncbi:MAG: hypothetical protein HN551_13390 [Tateyamaria sp.]|nr:hypothetical protein [Tateyamaria sp.]MBT6344174.1 hypothetical protein [Tateyamaria sp.]MBT7802226.1 hypothetical protein [Tateyamaria sp.]